jgi:glutamate-5-semialdehyde dehydrogenase
MTTRTVDDLISQGQAARRAARQLARLSTEVKNRTLHNLAELLETDADEALQANAEDCAEARDSGLSDAMIDRLLLTPERLRGVAAEQRKVASLPDPVGESIEMTTLPNGLVAGRRRVPLGVIASIYESRPNVTVDIFGLCFKSGNACILRGGKEALRSNSALIRLIRRALADAGAPAEAVQFLDNPDRELVDAMLKMRQYIDLVVPRGGEGLVRFVGENATMPAVTGGVGVCHTYIDRAADLDMAANVAFNAKVRRPYICNALDTLLVHSAVAVEGLPRIAAGLAASGVELHCDNRALSILGPSYLSNDGDGGIQPASEEDWGREFLSMAAAVKVVDSMDEALEHIDTYGSGHSEAIITEDYSAAMRFLDEVDAAAVYVNASTQFTDGGQFGLGAEVGISTQKMHARGPMGLKELTSYKWVIMGNGQVRP